MDQPPNSPSDARNEAQSLTTDELVQAATLEIRQLLETESDDTALTQFRQLHPVDQGEVLDGLEVYVAVQVLEALSSTEAADVLEEMDPAKAARVSNAMSGEDLARILDRTSLDAATDILQLLSAEKTETTIRAMAEADGVVRLLQYRQDSAGGVMTPDYPVVRESIITPNALDQLRLLGPEAENINSILVVDDGNRLVRLFEHYSSGPGAAYVGDRGHRRPRHHIGHRRYRPRGVRPFDGAVQLEPVAGGR